MFFATLVIAASLALPLTNQYERPSVSQPELSNSQIEELDKEGALLDPAAFRKPPLDCTDILDRVARNQIRFLERESHRYLILPNGDAIDAYRALALRDIENRMRTLTPTARERLQREFEELAPWGELAVRFEDGTISYDAGSIDSAKEGDTVYEITNLPPLFELPISPQPGTHACYPIIGSQEDSPETLNFDITGQTDHWLIGYVTQNGSRRSQRIAVHRSGAKQRLSRLDRSCVLWPLNKTAESRREYWDRAPLPLYVALDVDTIRATPAELACAAEQGRVLLRTHTPTSERTRSVTHISESIEGSLLKKRSRKNGPWLQTISWRSMPVNLRIVDYDTYQKNLAKRIERESTRPQTDTETPEPTHILKLKDGRTLKGRLDSTATDRTIKFTVIVGSIQQPMSFNRGDIKSIELIEDE